MLSCCTEPEKKKEKKKRKEVLVPSGALIVVRRLLRGPQKATQGERNTPAVRARKTSSRVRLYASRTSTKRVSCLGMSWRRNELIALTLPKSGVARTTCYVNCFVQPTANTETCLRINHSGEYRKAPFNWFSATANRRKCLKKSKSLRRIAKGAKLFLSTTANGKIGLDFFSPTVNCEKGASFFFSSRRRHARFLPVSWAWRCV